MVQPMMSDRDDVIDLFALNVAALPVDRRAEALSGMVRRYVLSLRATRPDQPEHELVETRVMLGKAVAHRVERIEAARGGDLEGLTAGT